MKRDVVKTVENGIETITRTYESGDKLVTKGFVESSYYVYLGDDGVPCAMEHDEYGEIGGLWFEGKKLTDYDGCFDMPKNVITLLTTLGYDCSDMIDDEDKGDE